MGTTGRIGGVKLSFIACFCLPAILFCTVFVGESNGAKILSFSFFSTPSHKITYEPVLLELAKRGHEVTIVSPVKSNKNMPNLRNIFTLDLEKMQKEMGLPNLFELRGHPLFKILGPWMNPFLFLGSMMDGVCRQSYALPQVQEIMKEKFDLIFFAPLFNECLYGLAHKMNTSVILFSQITTPFWVSSTLGTPSPPSFVPLPFMGFTDKMTFWQRVINFIQVMWVLLPMKVMYHPKVESIYRDVLNDPTIPSPLEIEANASLILANSHISFTKPRPLLPDIIDVGGLHLKPPSPVSKELEEFLSGNGDEGFIYFSMGSALKGSEMPEAYRQIFIQTFAKLKQRVLWKWETEQMDDLPKNVKLSKWLPQQDVLGHKNIRLFITHGGHGSTQEAIYHGVPLVGIPMLGDQEYNMKTAKNHGFAEPIEFIDLTEEILTTAINKVLKNPIYKEKAKELSSLFHDQIDKPLDRAVYWTEYVLRHNGATHLRSAARDLNFFQYHSIDVFALILAVLLLILYINFLVVRALLRKCCGSKSKSGAKKSQSKAKKTQ